MHFIGGRDQQLLLSPHRTQPGPVTVLIFLCALGQDVDFLEYSQYKEPTVAVCWDDGDLALQLRPAREIQELLQAWKEGVGSLTEPNFQKDFKQAKQNRKRGKIGGFRPQSSVTAAEQYGLRVIQPYGLLTETEYAALLADVPASTNWQPIQLPTAEPGIMSTHYLVDLAGMNPETVNGMRRVELYYDTTAVHTRTFLDAAAQIHQDQGMRSFAKVLKDHHALRPEGLKPRSN